MSGELVYPGIDIGGTNIKFGLVDDKGKVLHREQRPTMAAKGPEPLMHLITNIAERLLMFAAEEEYEVKFLGVGSPGVVDFKSGKVIGPCPNITGWQGMEIGSRLKARLNIPVFVDNDVNAMALAESTYGSATGAKSVICLTLGTGVGGAIIIDGKVHRGANSSAGELGHMTINFDGPRCNCGNNGCLETYCSSRSITTKVKALLKNGLTPIFEELLEGESGTLTIKKIFAAYRKGDEVATIVLEEIAGYVGIGLAGIVNLFNPEIVVIGGGIADGGGGFIDAVRKELKKRAFSSAVENLTIVRASLGNDAGFIGAGMLGQVD